MIIVVGLRQPKSKRLTCAGCRNVLEYLSKDLRDSKGLLYVDCPVAKCSTANYVGTKATVGDSPNV